MTSAVQIFRFIGLAIALCSCNGFAAEKTMPRYGVFVFSDLCVSPMSGDLGGDRITLHRFRDGDTLIYEYTDGSTHAVVAQKLMLDAQSKTLRFQIHDEGTSNVLVSGKLSSDGRSLTLLGLLFHEGEAVTLNRTTDFAAPLAACKTRN